MTITEIGLLILQRLRDTNNAPLNHHILDSIPYSCEDGRKEDFETACKIIHQKRFIGGKLQYNAGFYRLNITRKGLINLQKRLSEQSIHDVNVINTVGITNETPLKSWRQLFRETFASEIAKWTVNVVFLVWLVILTFGGCPNQAKLLRELFQKQNACYKDKTNHKCSDTTNNPEELACVPFAEIAHSLQNLNCYRKSNEHHSKKDDNKDECDETSNR